MSLLLSSEATANIIENNNCDPIYTDVKEIYFSYHSQLPGTEAQDWNSVSANLVKVAGDMLGAEGIPIKITNKAERDILANNPNALFLKLNYSYANKDSFSIPAPNDVVLTWVDMSRADSGGNIMHRISEVNYSPFTIRKSYVNAVLTRMPYGLVENIACNVLSFSTAKKCSNREDFKKSKLISVKRCIPQKHPDENLKNLFLENEE